ncbi:MAG: ABC transporter ATP-binding protein [Desulfotomaculales bacterium]
MLRVNDIHTFYGLSHILFGVSLEVKKGEVVCLLGRNGAGKTTTIRSIMGLVSPRQGEVVFKGEVITGQPPYRIARKGISWVPDNRRIFPDLTVAENLEIAEKKSGSGSKWNIEKVYTLFPVLKRIQGRRGGNLSGGEQQMLSIARALLGNPELLLLDEPTEGLAPLIVRELEEQILRLKEEGISILLAEQNLKSALRLADRCYVMERGRVCYQGTVDELNQNEEIRTRYLLV